MTANRKDQELEVKFYVTGLGELEQRTIALGARLVQPRTHEINLRFDTPDGELSRNFRVLRLRQDEEARLTFKGPAQDLDGARLRKEIEFIVSDFSAAQAFLEALGYRVMMIYEKYRTVYDLDNVQVTLDELPYGKFLELEGPDSRIIKDICTRLALNWDLRAPESYTMIFQRIREKLNLPFRDLSFENFQDLAISEAEMGIEPADR